MELAMINASPRKKGNTARLMESFAAGFTASVTNPDITPGMTLNLNMSVNKTPNTPPMPPSTPPPTPNTVRRFDLYDLPFAGCRSCFACKLRGGRSYGGCAVRDGLTDVLDCLRKTDAVLIGSPIYFGSVTGALQSFLERWLFPFSTYEAGYRSLWERRIPLFTIYTMNATQEQAAQLSIPQTLDRVEGFIAHVTGVAPMRQTVWDTCQFDDYSRYRVEVFSPEHKRSVRDTRFPTELHTARVNGEALARRLAR